jgi:hypothetical protein
MIREDRPFRGQPVNMRRMKPKLFMAVASKCVRPQFVAINPDNVWSFSHVFLIVRQTAWRWMKEKDLAMNCRLAQTTLM